VNSVRQLATRRRCPLDRVQTITLICTSLPNATYRGVSAAGFFAKQLAVLEDKASRVLEVEVNSPGLLSRVLRLLHNSQVGAHQSVFDMTNGKGRRREWMSCYWGHVVYGNDQISCGGVQSTEWLVTKYKSSNQPAGEPFYYCLTSPPGTFDPAVNQPCQLPAVPTYPQNTVPVWSSPGPNLSQTWTQPSGTSAQFIGIFVGCAAGSECSFPYGLAK
jgi:hypothetical protein